jgi:transcription termination factor Rho
MAERADAEAPRGGRLNSLPAVSKSELESKHLAELHTLAAEAGIERYRMLGRAELIEKLADGQGGGGSASGGARGGGSGRPRRPREERPRRQSREGKPGQEKSRQEKPAEEGRQRRRPEEPRGGRRRAEPREGGPPQRQSRGRQPQQPPPPPSESAAAAEPPAAAAEPAAGERPKRKRRRRRWGRRRKGLRVHDLLLPAAGGRQSIVYAESRATCTALLREVASELAEASNGPDPIALLIDPSPEELADWRRDVPQAEIVAAGKANHAGDAIGQAIRRAEGGENVIVLIDSLSRFAESYDDSDGARSLLDTALTASQSASGSLTVVAAVERGE